jgi:hypothetical protein
LKKNKALLARRLLRRQVKGGVSFFIQTNMSPCLNLKGAIQHNTEASTS